MADLENSSELLRQSLDELRKTGMLTAATLDKLNKASAKAANGPAELGEASKDAAANVNTFDKQLVRAVKNITDAGNAIRDNREDFRSLNPAIRASGIALGAAGRKIGGAVEGVGEAVSGLSLILGPKGKLIGMIGGGLLSGLGKAIGASSDAAAQLAVQFGEFATGELQKVVDAYRQVGAVGGIASGGMTELYDQSIAAGLSIGQFAKVIATNSEVLAKATGSTAKGAKVLSQLAQVGATTERQFLALGISFEQQRDFQAKFLEQNRLTGRIAMGDTRALTEASKQYIFQLDELSRITGLSREQAAKLLDEQNKNIRFRASVRMAEREFGPAVAEAMRNSVALIATAGKNTAKLGEGFEDLMGPGGASTEAARNLQIATGGAAKGIADMVRTGQMTADQGAAAIRQAIKNKMEGLGGDQYLAFVGKVEGPLQDMLLGMDDVAQAQNLTVANLTQARKDSVAASNAQDKNTKEIIDAQMALQKFAIELDKLVKEKILPTAATAVKTFTQTLLSSVDFINEKLGINPGGGGGGAGRGGSGGAGRGSGQAQAPTTGVGGAGAPSPEAAGTLGAIRNMIGRAESNGGDYNIMVGGKRGNLTNMTLAQILEQQSKMNKRNGFESSALGKYQITQGTLRDLINKTGMDVNTTMFDQATQDKLADELIVSRGGYNKYAAGAISKEKFMRNLSTIWAGLPMDASGRSYYQGVGSNKATIGFDEAMGSFAYGGISSGPKSGYMSMLHGTEAVIPLPGGRSVPVEMTGMTDKIGEQVGMMSAQLDRLDEMVSLMRTSNDTNAKILRASQN
jgi:muramidase (phage lysozyme)